MSGEYFKSSMRLKQTNSTKSITDTYEERFNNTSMNYGTIIFVGDPRTQPSRACGGHDKFDDFGPEFLC